MRDKVSCDINSSRNYYKIIRKLLFTCSSGLAGKSSYVLEMRCYRKILHISNKDHVTNQKVRAKIQQAIGPHEDLLTILKRRKLRWYDHVFPFIRCGQNHLARHSERGKKSRQTEEEVERQHQGMDRPGVRQVAEGSGEQGKMEETGRKIICDAQTTLAVKG